MGFMTTRTLFSCAIASLAIALTTTPSAAADRGLQFTPDGKRALANKDVGNERWAITLNNDDGSITGNVFRTDGPPAFIACDPLAGDNNYACFGADACSDGSGAQRGIQRTPDGDRVLANKNVGNERWAITLNDDDGSVTGNVFREGGGDPAFLACDALPAPDSFSCSGADACGSQPCSDLYSFIDNVTLPSSFFDVPAPCSEPFSFISNVTLPEDFFQLDTVDEFVSSVETESGVPGALRVGVAPIPGPGSPSPISGVAGSTSASPGGTNDLAITFSGASSATTAAVQGDSQFTGLALVVAIANGQCTPSNILSDWYQIPLVTSSGSLSISVGFSQGLASGNFVICITIIDSGVVGQYFVVQQTNSSATCGNSVLETGEVCDPPAAQSQCPTGDLCSNNCQQCVPATSCAGRCCLGRDDTCTAESAPCFCDEFCFTANDCCEDASAECGFGPAPQVPSISGLSQQLIQLNAPTCELAGGPVGSLFVGRFNYSDPDGDVTTNGSIVQVMFQFLPGGSPASFSGPVNVVSGTPSSGVIEVGQCYRFGETSSLNTSISIRDDAGNLSNSLTANIQQPQGAN